MAQAEDESKMHARIRELVTNVTPIPCESSPYLEPEDSAFSPVGRWSISAYQVKVAQTLLEPIERASRGEGHKEIASLVCLPSFMPEWALWIAGERTTGFSALLTEPEQSIWYSIMTAEIQFSEAPVRMYQCQLPTDRAEAICDTWRRVLSQTRYPKASEFGCDGVYYHFGYWTVGSSPLAGKTWSPEETTVPGKLAELGRSLRDYVKDTANQDVFLKVMEDQLEWLQTHAQRVSEWST